MSETKRERFVRLSSGRVNKARKAITNVAFLARGGDYEYTEAEAEQIVNELRSAVKEVSAAFAANGYRAKAREPFSLV